MQAACCNNAPPTHLHDAVDVIAPARVHIHAIACNTTRDRDSDSRRDGAGGQAHLHGAIDRDAVDAQAQRRVTDDQLQWWPAQAAAAACLASIHRRQKAGMQMHSTHCMHTLEPTGMVMVATETLLLGCAQPCSTTVVAAGSTTSVAPVAAANSDSQRVKADRSCKRRVARRAPFLSACLQSGVLWQRRVHSPGSQQQQLVGTAWRTLPARRSAEPGRRHA